MLSLSKDKWAWLAFWSWTLRGQGLRLIIPHADFSTPLFSVWHSPLLLVGSQVLNFSGFSPGNKPLLRECEIRSYLTVMGKNSKPGVLNIPHPDFLAISLSSSSPFFLCHARPCNSCNDFCTYPHILQTLGLTLLLCDESFVIAPTTICL